MAKITSRTKAQELVALRQRKIRESLSNLRHAVSGGRSKVNYALHFWLGAESAGWFMARNDINPDALQAEFDELGVEAFAESEQTHALADQIKEAEARFFAELDAIVAKAGA